MPPRQNLRLASFDGGGVRGFSQLEIMGSIMHRLSWKKRPMVSLEQELPCDHFDMIGGSGTGGLIAIMFTRLRMSVEEASQEFYTIVDEVYTQDALSPLERTNSLRRCMENVLKRKGFPLDMKLMDNAWEKSCAGFVVASLRNNVAAKSCLRTYLVATHPPSTITVVEAVLATCTNQPAFAPVSIGERHKRREYVGAGFGANNPIHRLIIEAHELFDGDSKVTSLLSLGTGHPGIITFPSGDDQDLYIVMRKMMEDCEEKAQEFEQQFRRSGIYSRFSVEQGMQEQNPSQEMDPSWISTQAESYLQLPGTCEKLESFVRNAGGGIGLITLNQIKHVGVQSSSRLAATAEKLLESFISNEDDGIIAKLKPTDLECGSHVTGCMDGTRRDILAQFDGWANDESAPNILWVKGHPGVGKSAIATSFVEKSRLSRRLGSSFFFRRERANILTPRALWRTVAYDLARQHPTIRKFLVATLRKDESIIATYNIDELFRQLIQEPLMASEVTPIDGSAIVIVDALDECGGLDGHRSTHRKSLTRTLRDWSRLPGRFKLVVTSRGENDLETLFSATSHHLLEIPVGKMVDDASSDDIKAFLKHQFEHIAAQYQSLPPDWPGHEAINDLTEKAAGLFIWAKTIIDFIAQGKPTQGLRYILEGSGAGGMANLYLLILQIAFPRTRKEDIADFHAVLGAIIFLKTPLTASTLTQLLSVEDSATEHVYSRLKPVLDSRDVLSIKHQSFADFLMDPQACPSTFLIDQEQGRRNLIFSCLRAMRENLRFNICDLESSYVRNGDVQDLASRIDEHLPPHLSYSCCFWTDYLAEAAPDDVVLGDVQEFMRDQFLFWLEVLSLTKRTNLASSIVRSLRDWIKNQDQDDSLARDMEKFISVFSGIISESVPHIYLSALPFSPRSSAVRKRYINQYPQTLIMQSKGYDDWPAGQKVFSGHDGHVLSISFSPDGRHIVSGSSDNTIIVWDAETGDLVTGPLTGHKSRVSSVAFSPHGKCIISGSSDGTIRMWDAKTGRKVIGPLKGHKNSVNSVAFSRDGRHIASGSSDNTIIVWDAGAGDIVTGPLIGHKNSVKSVAFSPDDRRIVSGSSDATIRIWDAKTGEIAIGPLREHEGKVNSVKFSPDGSLIVSGSSDKTVRIWNAETGDIVTEPLMGHEDVVNSVTFSPDGRRVISGSSDTTVRMWDAETGEIVTEPLRGHKSVVQSVAYSPDGRHIVSASKDRAIRIWDSEADGFSIGPTGGHNSSAFSVAFSSDGSPFLSSSHDNKIRVWNAKTGALVTETEGAYESSIISIAFSPNGKHIVAGSKEKKIWIWDAEKGHIVGEPLKGHRSSVNSVSFSVDGRRIVSGSSDKTIRIWDLKMGRTIIGPLEGHTNAVNSVAFSPDGTRIVSGSSDNNIRVWGVKTGNIVPKTLIGHKNAVKSVAFSPDGGRIVSGSSDATIRIWDAKTGKILQNMPIEHRCDVKSVVFSLDGRRIVSGLSDGTIWIWDAETGGVAIRPLTGHESSVEFVAFSPDGKCIFSGSSDAVIRVWIFEEDLSINDRDLVRDTSKHRYFSNIKDGWVLGRKDELLFWVPPSLRKGIYLPSNKLVIGSCIITPLDLTSFVHGEAWTRCREKPFMGLNF